jgi:hypothetical protein
MNGYRKGQYFSFDAIIATLIFILTMVSIFSYWYNTKSALENQNSEMVREAARISDMIFMVSSSTTSCQVSFGIPDASNPQSTQQQSYRTLLLGSKYCTAEADLQNGYGTPYKVYIEIRTNPSYDTNGKLTTDPPTTMGDAPKSDSETVKLRRIASVVDSSTTQTTYSKAIVDVYIYK